MGHSRGHTIGVLALVAVLGAASTALQIGRDNRYATARETEQVLYVQSPAVMQRLVLSYDALAADVYWIRALQHYGRTRQAQGEKRYELLYPLLDLTTSLDPRFNIAYRFGATFLSQSKPGGPGRPDQAIALLKKGLDAMPLKWQYCQDIGFVHYWTRHDYVEAATWFKRASEIRGAPWWLKPLAANTLAKGGDRKASRLLYSALADSAENDFLRRDAVHRLRQLDTLDVIDQLRAIERRYLASGGQPPITWKALVAAGLLRGVPIDSDGYEFQLDPASGNITLHKDSSLNPLPEEPPAALRQP